MPRRSSDPNAKPFEFRPGIGGFPPLGGMFRSGDPATIPPNKHHLVVNARITPGGMKTRPGLSLLYSTGVTECIVGITSEEEELSTVLLYPGAPEGTDGFSAPLNAMTFRAIWPQGGDLTYSEYAAVGFGSPSKDVGTRSKVIQPLALDGSHVVGGTDYYGCASMVPSSLVCPPFLLNGRVHAFMVMPKPNAEDGWDPALALVVMDLPGRTKEVASDDQRSTGTAGLSGDPDLLFPFEYPLGTSQVVFYPKNPFAGAETINCVMDVLVWAQRGDDPTTPAAPGVREVLFMLVRGSADTIAVVRWDGVAETTIKLKTGLSMSPLPPLIGAQADGPFVLASTDGLTGNYAGYLNSIGVWTELAQGVVYDYGIGGVPVAPGEVAPVIEHWGAYKETYAGRGIIAFQGLMKRVYGGAWVDSRGIWAFEMGADAWNVPVATFVLPAVTAVGLPWPGLRAMVDQYMPVDVVNEKLVAGAYYDYEDEDESRVYKSPYLLAPPGASYLDAGATTVNAWKKGALTEEGSSQTIWELWIRTVAGRLYAGGSHYDVPTVTRYDSAFDVTTTQNDEAWRGPVLVDSFSGLEVVTRGCLGTAPSAEIAEGWGASEEA